MTTSQTAVGALPYMAPEAIENPASVGAPADIWSVGAMMYHLLSGSYPFGQGLRAVPRIIAAQVPDVPPFLTAKAQLRLLARELIDITVSCLKKYPAERPTADQLVAKCSNLCYTSAPRDLGVVNSHIHNAFGFISTSNGHVFFHKDCVYGDLPQGRLGIRLSLQAITEGMRLAHYQYRKLPFSVSLQSQAPLRLRPRTFPP